MWKEIKNVEWTPGPAHDLHIEYVDGKEEIFKNAYVISIERMRDLDDGITTIEKINLSNSDVITYVYGKDLKEIFTCQT